MQTVPMNERHRRASTPTRRQFNSLLLGSLSLAWAAVAVPWRANAGHPEAGEKATPALVTDFEDNALLLSQIRYVPVSVQEGKQCGSCALLVQRDGDYGRCGLFQRGQVPVVAYCASWIQKPGA
jgi:hypothetical protein